jgi:hypothetical protein
MPWVRYDDRYRLHRKIRPLSDRLFRLATEAIMWSASEENLTDGRIERTDLPDIRPKATATDATALVTRGVWHRAGDPCDSPTCPPPNVGTGWRIHDYFDYQPSRAKVIADKAAKAERQRNWMARRRGGSASTSASRDASTGPSRDASEDAAPYPVPAPPRPEGKRGGDLPEAPPARRQAAGAAAGPVSDEHNRAATADPHPNGQPVDPPTELLADVRKRLAEASSRARRSTARPGAFDELAAATPDVPPLVEPQPEAS